MCNFLHHISHFWGLCNQKHLDDTLGHFHFTDALKRKVHTPTLVVDHLLAVCPQEGIFDLGFCNDLNLEAAVQQLMALFHQLRLREKKMPGVHGLLQCVLDGTSITQWILQPGIGFPGYCIHCEKAEAFDPAQLEWIRLHNAQACVAVFLIDLFDLLFGHAEGCHIGRQIPKVAALLVARYNLLQLALSYPFDHKQLIGISVKDLQSPRSEFSHNSICRCRPDALDASGTEIGLDTRSCLGLDFGEMGHRKLEPILGLLPVTLQLHINDAVGWQIIANCRKVDFAIIVVGAFSSLLRHTRVLG